MFPLAQALLLPGGLLPLNIFEPRYLAMVEDALAAGRLFGMIQPDVSRPAGPTGPALSDVGCLGRLIAFSETGDGRYLITLTGIARFAVTEELAERRGYRRVRADFSEFRGDLEPSFEPLSLDREALLAVLRQYFAAAGLQADWESVERMDDDNLVSTLCIACPFSAPEKQALLEARTPADRAAALIALLRMGAAGGAGPGPMMS